MLQNPQECGHGYGEGLPKGMIDWHFVANDVIDFAWADDFVLNRQMEADRCSFIRRRTPATAHGTNCQPSWPAPCNSIRTTTGTYPGAVHGDRRRDGSMEYPMCTLVQDTTCAALSATAHGNARLVQGLLATNESLHEWMDEGTILDRI